MPNTNYQRNTDQLEKHAVQWWPPSLMQREGATSIVPRLLETLDDFMAVLRLAKDRPDQVFDVLQASSVPGNVFLKHLCILADFGGEPLMRVNKNFEQLFEKRSGKFFFSYFWKQADYDYEFQALPVRGLNNKKLHLDGPSLANDRPLDSVSKDVAMLLLHGASITNASSDAQSSLSKCDIGLLLGSPDEIETYVKERYIHVSRITNGAKANTLGQVAQSYVKEFILNELGEDYRIHSGSIHLSTHEKEQFDVVVEKHSKSVGIEVSFQVTTNSTIERKAKQAQLRQQQLRDDGHYVAYVIDGAGNFARKNAIATICANSDCTVAYSDNELKLLVNFIRTVLG